MSVFQSDTTYDLGDEVIYIPRKIVSLTGFAWLWAKLTGKPTEWTEEGEPQVYRVGDVADIPSDYKWTDLS